MEADEQLLTVSSDADGAELSVETIVQIISISCADHEQWKVLRELGTASRQPLPYGFFVPSLVSAQAMSSLVQRGAITIEDDGERLVRLTAEGDAAYGIHTSSYVVEESVRTAVQNLLPKQ